MKALVIYDSVYGNTKKIAETVAGELGCSAIPVSSTSPGSLQGISLLIIGSPTHGGSANPALQKFMAGIPAGSLSGLRVASFDTWISSEGQGFFMRLLIGILGHAAPRILSRLQKLGGKPAAEPMGFLVKGKEGPLADGELWRAKEWAKKIANG